jgi:hypothetical protein
MSGHDFEVQQAEDVVPTRRLAIIACAAFGIGAACVAISAYLESAHLRELRAGVRSYPAPAPSGTTERTLIETTYRGHDLNRAQLEALDSYGWIDRQNGIARIPIERAIELTVEQNR